MNDSREKIIREFQAEIVAIQRPPLFLQDIGG